MDFNVMDQILGNFFCHQADENKRENSQIFMCFKKSCDSDGRVVSHTIFIDFCLIITVLVLIKCVYMKPVLKTNGKCLILYTHNILKKEIPYSHLF
jgi:hypothetical protein